MDTPLENPDMEIFTDGSSFVRDGKPKAGYAVVTAEHVFFCFFFLILFYF